MMVVHSRNEMVYPSPSQSIAFLMNSELDEQNDLSQKKGESYRPKNNDGSTLKK